MWIVIFAFNAFEIGHPVFALLTAFSKAWWLHLVSLHSHRGARS